MMLVVFTAFLGMELKTAVGTSTFIMTFTALIASVSHILIHPAILMGKWKVMLLCIDVATAASKYSAWFANRVSNRTVGLATGAVLTVLGGAIRHTGNVRKYALSAQSQETGRNSLIKIAMKESTDKNHDKNNYRRNNRGVLWNPG